MRPVAISSFLSHNIRTHTYLTHIRSTSHLTTKQRVFSYTSRSSKVKMAAERTNAHRSRQATNNPPLSLRRQDAVIHQTVTDGVQVIDFGIYTNQVNDILSRVFGDPPVPRPRHHHRAVDQLNMNLPHPVMPFRRRNPEEVDTLPLYTKLPGVGETTVDISPSEQSEVLPEYSQAKREEGRKKAKTRARRMENLKLEANKIPRHRP